MNQLQPDPIAEADVYVDAQLSNEILMELADEAAAEFEPQLRDAYPEGMPTQVKVNKEQQMAMFLATTESQDVPWLLMPNYLDGFKVGIYPELVSPRWIAAMADPGGFNEDQKDFRRLWREFMEPEEA